MLKILVSTVILVNKKNEILMEKHHKYKHLQHLWQFPGGKVEPNELIKSAAVRELKEELGISITEKSLNPIGFEDYFLDNKHYVIFYFLCKNWNSAIKNKEHQLLKWFLLEEIKIENIIEYNYNIFQQLLEMLENNNKKLAK